MSRVDFKKVSSNKSRERVALYECVRYINTRCPYKKEFQRNLQMSSNPFKADLINRNQKLYRIMDKTDLTHFDLSVILRLIKFLR